MRIIPNYCLQIVLDHKQIRERQCRRKATCGGLCTQHAKQQLRGAQAEVDHWTALLAKVVTP